MIPDFLLVDTPNTYHIGKYNLNVLLDAKGVLERVCAIVHAEFMHKKFDKHHLIHYTQCLIRTICQIQVESRGLPIDMNQINELVDAIQVEEVAGSCEIIMNKSWEQKINKLFCVWICPKCNKKILEIQHTIEECRNNTVSSVIDE